MPIRETFFGNTARHLASLPLCRRRLEKALASMYKPLAHAPPVTKVNLSPHPTSITHRPPQLGSAKLLAFRFKISSRGVVAHEERVEDDGALDRLEDVRAAAVDGLQRPTPRVPAVAVRERGHGQGVDGRPAQESRRQRAAPQRLGARRLVVHDVGGGVSLCGEIKSQA